MDPTGGLREISKLRESHSSFAEDLSDEEQPQETSSPLVGQPPKLRRPRTRYPWKPAFLASINKSQVNRRLRLVFRIFSMIASGTILGSLGSVLYIYETTKMQISHHGGGFIWPMGVDYLATRVQLAAAVLTFVADLGFFVASYKVAVRRLDTALLKTFALVTTSACIGVLAAAIVTYEVAAASMRPTLMWTCTAKTLQWDEAMTVDFPFLCGEMVTILPAHMWLFYQKTDSLVYRSRQGG
jgi:hypothetical protein